VEQHESKTYEPDIVIQKDEQVLASLKNALQKGLYPSHLNMYINCSLQYYFNKIAGLKETDDIEEKIGADQFGNIVHKVLEDYFKPFREKNLLVTAQDIDRMRAVLPQRVQLAFKTGVLGNVPEQGMNYLLLKVATQVLDSYLKKQAESPDLPLRIISLEQVLETVLEVNLEDEVIKVKIAGKADRIDRTAKATRVIDYKTGLVNPADLKIKQEHVAENLLTNRKYEKVRQLWLYRYLMAKKMQAEGSLSNTLFQPEIEAGIISFRNLNAGFMTSDIAFSENKPEALDEYIQYSEEYLRTFVQDMLNPDIPIRKTHDLEVCQYCIYRGICAR
ncbi:MAG: PD-(D/E)XK nuclease family protein, partial [Bacteroidota bacterium]|nr:PD-(D/E)XK nuclease family protein [Bacteroidota bacterium]